jgi:hypothetical protein
LKIPIINKRRKFEETQTIQRPHEKRGEGEKNNSPPQIAQKTKY